MSLVKIEAASNGSPRVVFFDPVMHNISRSIPSAAAYSLAKNGKRVLFFDFYIDYSYLTNNFLHSDRAPKFGVIDWLSGNFENNEHTVYENMVTVCNFDSSGSLYFVPSYGSDTHIRTKTNVFREQVVEFRTKKSLEKTSKKYRKLIDLLEHQIKPDVIFIDTCSDMMNSVLSLSSDIFLLGLSANLLFLFKHDDHYYSNAYYGLFCEMKEEDINLGKLVQKVKIITSFFFDIEKINSNDYNESYKNYLKNHFEMFRNDTYKLFDSYLYRGDWKFDLMDNDVPHTPLNANPIYYDYRDIVKSDSLFYDSLFKRFETLGDDQLRSNIGSLVDYITKALSI